MLRAYRRIEGRLHPAGIEPLAEDVVWLDLIDPVASERRTVAEFLRHELPATRDVGQIEASARSYEDPAGLHVHSLFLHEVDGQPRNTSVAFTLSGDRLVTLRQREIPAFRLLRRQASHDPAMAVDAMCIVLGLLEIQVYDIADTLEEVYQGLEEVSVLVLERNNVNVGKALDCLARHEDTNGKVRLCLMDIQRAIIFLLRRGPLGKEQADRAHELSRDIESLLPHNSFVFDKINFLMDAAQGFINIEQNQVIKILSIAAVVFLPPTLVASIYGMNFRHLPELGWSLGYPWALGLMLLSGIAPYWYFKWKRWL